LFSISGQVSPNQSETSKKGKEQRAIESSKMKRKCRNLSEKSSQTAARSLSTHKHSSRPNPPHPHRARKAYTDHPIHPLCHRHSYPAPSIQRTSERACRSRECRGIRRPCLVPRREPSCSLGRGCAERVGGSSFCIGLGVDRKGSSLEAKPSEARRAS
jgi:hypothetical protein